MSDTGAEKSGSITGKAASPSGKRGRVKYFVLLGLALIALIAVQTGLAGFALARLRAATFPRDEALLEYVPANVDGVVIVDPHQVKLASLGAEGGVARTYIERTRADIKKATGIDLGFDVDKLALTPSGVVARGRFSHKRLAAELEGHGYVEAEHKGVKYLARAGEDAIAVIDSSILLYGDDTWIRAAIDAEAEDTGLAERDEVTDRLSAVGWDHPILGTAQLSDSKPSLRAILTGSTGPRAVTVGVSMGAGMTIRAAIEAASPSAAEELRKLLTEKQGDAAALKDMTGEDVGAVLVGIAKRAKISAEAGSSQLAIDADVSPEELEKLAKATEKAAVPLSAMYKNVRLFQLLMP